MLVWFPSCSIWRARCNRRDSSSGDRPTVAVSRCDFGETSARTAATARFFVTGLPSLKIVSPSRVATSVKPMSGRMGECAVAVRALDVDPEVEPEGEACVGTTPSNPMSCNVPREGGDASGTDCDATTSSTLP